ncbi:major facilitator superfamily domain-containing protein [Podospora aff. communis PSN243]|uniref:Major facilitator superfamily domain-containing protein n=1 Tax=Podospora aff. communis PSN243 TaxID=3040156 RepID=A0AAV9GW11_9PEZI|nr:major facilitator superfamily domain-containing protein [Podospora aff. communis PSN243]
MATEPDIENQPAPLIVHGLKGQPSSDSEGPAPSNDEFQPPDGGLVAWSQVAAGCLINMMAWGYPSTFGVFQLYYRDTLGLPEAQISWIGSLQTFLAFFLCTLSGRLADAGHVRSTVIAGSFLVVFGTFMTSLATKYWEIFLAQGLCTGLGLGIVFMPPLAIINSYFDKNRSYALAISATGTGIGSVVFPATIQYLIPQIGFPWAVRCSAFVALFISAASLSMLRPRLSPRKSGPLVEWQAFKELPYTLFAIGGFLFFWALYFGFFFVNAYARNVIGFSTTDSVQLLLIVNGLSVPSRPVVGYLADRYIGPINLFSSAIFLLGVVSFAWIGVTTRTGMYVFTVFFGLSNGAAQGVFVGSLASLTKDPRKMGTRFGMVCTIAAFATLAGPPTSGAIIDKSDGRYTWAQIWAGLVIILSAVMMASARVAATGMRLKVKI